jgi:hypothetical protein
MIKNHRNIQNGNVTIYVLIVLEIVITILSSFTFKKNKFQDNSNLYYIADSVTNKSLGLVNKILNFTLHEVELDKYDNSDLYKLFIQNTSKFLPDDKIQVDIKNKPHDYSVKITFHFNNDFDCDLESYTYDSYNDNNIKIIANLKKNGNVFECYSYKTIK